MFNVEPLCSFCHHTDESLCHLFWDCPFSQTFWCDLNLFLNRKLDTLFKITIECILFGLFDKKIPIKKLFIINLFTLLAKFHIHTSLFTKQKLNFFVFMSYCKSYLDTLNYCKNSKAFKNASLM